MMETYHSVSIGRHTVRLRLLTPILLSCARQVLRQGQASPQQLTGPAEPSFAAAEPLGLAALLTLALGEDADARRELLRRIESAEVEPWWTAATAFAQASEDEERLSLLRLVVRSNAIPPGGKAQVVEALGEMDVSLALVDDPAHVDLAEEIALSRGVFPLIRRARTAWALGKAGRLAPLEALWA